MNLFKRYIAKKRERAEAEHQQAQAFEDRRVIVHIETSDEQSHDIICKGYYFSSGRFTIMESADSNADRFAKKAATEGFRSGIRYYRPADIVIIEFKKPESAGSL